MNMKKTPVIAAHTRCSVSVSVLPPAASTARWCMGGQNCPNTVYAISSAPTTRRARLGGADFHTIHPKATIRAA